MQILYGTQAARNTCAEASSSSKGNPHQSEVCSGDADQEQGATAPELRTCQTLKTVFVGQVQYCTADRRSGCLQYCSSQTFLRLGLCCHSKSAGHGAGYAAHRPLHGNQQPVFIEHWLMEQAQVSSREAAQIRNVTNPTNYNRLIIGCTCLRLRSLMIVSSPGKACRSLFVEVKLIQTRALPTSNLLRRN